MTNHETDLIFACTDFRVRKKVTVGANLQHLIYNVLIDIIFLICFGIS